MPAKGYRIGLIDGAVLKILNRPAVQYDLMERAEAIADRAGGEAAGFVAEQSVSPDRASAQVVTTTYEARAREARDRTLTAAIDAGRS